MKRTWTIIGVSDVALSFKWYQSLFGQPATAPGHDHWGQICDADGTVLLCLHQWGSHEHPSLLSAAQSHAGNGLLLFFRVDDFDLALHRARLLVPAFGEEPHLNPSTETLEFSLRDPDGYYVTISALADTPPALRHSGEPDHPVTPAQLLSFMRAQPWAVEASVTTQGAPQAAVIGVAVTDRGELLFDTVSQSRKHRNLLANPRVAFVIGWEQERTVQYEGIAEVPTDAELPDAKRCYFDRFPDAPARQTWPGIVYWRVRPTWIRYSDFNANPPIIQEWDAAAIAGWLQ
jgi:general stress protein 26